MAANNSTRLAGATPPPLLPPIHSADAVILHQIPHPTQEGRSMDSSVEEIMDNIGFGYWQILYILSTCMIRVCRAIQYINTVFVNRPISTEYFIYKPQNYSYEFLEINLENSDIIKVHENCEQASPYIASFVCGNTFSNEFKHFGDRDWISSLYQMIFVLGCMFGAGLGAISDLFGRVLVIRLSALSYLVSAILISVSPNIYAVLIARFIIGLSDNLILATSQTLLMEITPKKYMTSVGLLVFLPFAAAAMTFAGIAYLVRSWRTLNLICSVPVLFSALIVIFLRKSPRWLITQGYFEEAVDIIVNAAKTNKQQLPQTDEVMSTIAACDSNDSFDGNKEATENSKVHKIKSLCFSFFATPHMCKLSIIIPNLWVIASFVFYGFTLNANNFTSNIYLYVFLTNGFSVIPSLIGSLMVNRLGNKWIYILLSTLTGLCLLGLLVLPEEVWWVKWVLTIIAFMASSLQYDLNSVMTSELLPTVLRTTGTGISLLAGNVGILLACYLFETVAHHVWWVPNGLCALFCVIATSLVILLPETNGQQLCETVEQVEERGNSNNKK